MKIDTNLCVEMMKYFVGYEKEDIRFGSWKDMKYLFNELQDCPIEMVQIINSQLVKDMSLMKQNKSCSLLCFSKLATIFNCVETPSGFSDTRIGATRIRSSA